MRILFVHNIAPWDARAGGGQRIHHEIAQALVQRGHEGHALFLGPPSQPGTPVPYPFTWAPEAPRFANNLKSMADATRRLLEAWIPEVAYLSSPESAGVYRELPRRTGTLMTSHHPEPPDLLGSTTWRRPLRSARTLRNLQRPLMERWLLQNAQRRSATSAYGRDTLYQRGYLEPGAPVTLIPNGVAASWFNDQRGAGSRANFLFVGRMDDQKGVDVLLRAFSQMDPASAPGPAWTLDLIGDGWMRERYERLGAELNLEGRIRFLGHGDPSSVKEAMTRAAVLVAPSRAENYPLILLEAMAAGLPVISTRVGGIGEMVEEGQSGMLVEPGDTGGTGQGDGPAPRGPSSQGAIDGRWPGRGSPAQLGQGRRRHRGGASPGPNVGELTRAGVPRPTSAPQPRPRRPPASIERCAPTCILAPCPVQRSCIAPSRPHRLGRAGPHGQRRPRHLDPPRTRDSPTTSGTAEVAAEITGHPDAIASRSGSPNPS